MRIGRLFAETKFSICLTKTVGRQDGGIICRTKGFRVEDFKTEERSSLGVGESYVNKRTREGRSHSTPSNLGKGKTGNSPQALFGNPFSEKIVK